MEEEIALKESGTVGGRGYLTRIRDLKPAGLLAKIAKEPGALPGSWIHGGRYKI